VAFHNPLCPAPIKRCCHAYGQELTGRSQHGHGSARIRARARSFHLRCAALLRPPVRGATAVAVPEQAAEEGEEEEEEDDEDHGSIGEHLDLWMYRQLSDRVTHNRTPHAHMDTRTHGARAYSVGRDSRRGGREGGTTEKTR